jgi:type II secretory pathway component PulM
VRVQLEAAPIDIMITWLATLDARYGLAIESITVDRAARPGVVNANVTFAQPRP